MLKKILLIGGLVLILAVACSKTTNNTTSSDQKKELVNFNKLTKLTFQDYDKFLADKKSGLVYFGWIDKCGDSLNFQENYLEQLLSKKPELLEQLIVVNMDASAPEALKNKELRKPILEKYNVQYSPTLLRIKDGQIDEKLEWTLKNNDPKTAIDEQLLNQFFGVK